MEGRCVGIVIIVVYDALPGRALQVVPVQVQGNAKRFEADHT